MKKIFLPTSFPFQKSICLFFLVALVYLFTSSFKNTVRNSYFHSWQDSVLSKAAFLKVYDVLISPRCMNCHPSGDVPLVGDDSHLHKQGAKRGIDGRGTFAKCTNCHLDENIAGINMPTGSPDWRMTPANMKMVFQGKTARQLAKQLLDTGANGNKSTTDLIKHVSKDPLVLIGWNPGEGRKTPPLAHAEFVKQFELWINNGAYLPGE